MILQGSQHPQPSSSFIDSTEKVSIGPLNTEFTTLFNSYIQMLKIKSFKVLKQEYFLRPSGNSHFTWFVVTSVTYFTSLQRLEPYLPFPASIPSAIGHFFPCCKQCEWSRRDFTRLKSMGLKRDCTLESPGSFKQYRCLVPLPETLI